MNDEYLVWRLWSEKNIPLNEIRFQWTYADLLKANAILDMQEANTLGVEGLPQE